MQTIKPFIMQRYLIGILVLVNLLGLFNPLFLGDSALYACISKEIALSGNWFELFVKGLDWLDKPHFPFWVTAFFFKLFGVSTFVYKLPSLLFFGLSVIYTWKLARRLYSTEIAELSVLILLSAMHIMVSNNDVRAEPILMGTLIPATYFFVMLYKRYTLHDLLLGSLFAAFAVMTKGYFVLIPIVAAVTLQALAKNEWRKLWHWKWAAASALICLFILPELYAVYIQFDLHPEKVMFNKTGVSGIKFVLWDSQFGRFFNSGPIQGNGEPTFFLHTLIWAFAPWGLLGFVSLFAFSRNWIKKIAPIEFFNFGAFVSMFVIFSVSKFQLPHYINIILPFLSILVANYLSTTFNVKVINRLRRMQYLQIFVFSVFLLAIYFYFQPGKPFVLGAIVAFIGLLKVLIFGGTKAVMKRIIQLSVVLGIFTGLFLNLLFYPKLLSYQGGNKASVYVNSTHPNQDVFVPRETNSYTFEFLLDANVKRFNIDELNSTPPKNALVYTFKKHVELLLEKGTSFEVLQQFDDYHITLLKPDFINPKTRAKTLGSMYLIRLNSK